MFRCLRQEGARVGGCRSSIYVRRAREWADVIVPSSGGIESVGCGLTLIRRESDWHKLVTRKCNKTVTEREGARQR